MRPDYQRGPAGTTIVVEECLGLVARGAAMLRWLRSQFSAYEHNSNNMSTGPNIETGLSKLGHYYCDFEDLGDADLKALALSFGMAAPQLSALQIQHKAQLEATKGRFNLFTVLLSIGDETRLHSRWLAHLLDPSASHDCGSLFLDLFLETLRRNGVQPHVDEGPLDHLNRLEGFESKSAKVRREIRIDNGRIDIQIESRNWGTILIENKVWAAEQLEQIQRYAGHLNKKHESGNHGFLLLYLTRDGTPSETAGDFANHYYRISYRAQILDWLEECLRATYQYVNINQALQQYRNLVSELTGRSSDNDYMDKVIRILKEHPAIIELFDHITTAFGKLKEEYWRQFSAELQSQLSARGLELRGPEPLNKNVSQLLFSAKSNVQATAKYELRFLIEWNEGVKSFFLGASGPHYNQEARKEIQVICTSSRLPVQFQKEFPASYRGVIDDWWPLGYLDLIQQGEFMTNAFLAKGLAESNPIAGQTKPLVDVIVRYFEIVRANWPGEASPLSAVVT